MALICFRKFPIFFLNISKCFSKYLENIQLHFINITVKTPTKISLSANFRKLRSCVAYNKTLNNFTKSQPYLQCSSASKMPGSLHFSTGRVRDRPLGAEDLKRSRRDTTIWFVRGSEGISKAILLNISNCNIAYIINGEYC